MALGVVGVATPAHGHTELERVSPAAGDVVSLSTDHLVLEFTDELFSVGNKVVVRDPTGTDVAVGDPTGSGRTLDVRIGLGRPGRHSVAYRVVGSDGHVISGSSWFRVSAEQSPGPSAAAPAGRSSGEPSEGVVAEIGKASSETSGGAWWWLVAAILGGMVVALHTLSRRHGRAEHHETPNPVSVVGTDQV